MTEVMHCRADKNDIILSALKRNAIYISGLVIDFLRQALLFCLGFGDRYRAWRDVERIELIAQRKRNRMPLKGAVPTAEGQSKFSRAC